MSSGGVIIIAGLAIAAGVLIWKRCEIDFMSFMCEGSGKENPMWKEYSRQRDWNDPKTKAAVNANLNTFKKNTTPATSGKDKGKSAWCTTYSIGCPAKSAYTNSLYSQGTRLAI